jgi:hypothetical protein
MNNMLNGQCHCGEVTWQATLPHTIALNCHCNLCRSLNGADYSSWVILPEAQFQLLSGEDKLSHYQASDKFSKTFCAHCGSTVSCVNDDKFPGNIYVAKGNIVSNFDLPAQLQVFTQFKADWVTLAEDIPVFNPE